MLESTATPTREGTILCENLLVAFKGEIIWKGHKEKGGRCRVRERAGKTRSADVPGRWAQSAAVAAALQAMLWRCESGESQRGRAKKSLGSLGRFGSGIGVGEAVSQALRAIFLQSVTR